MSEPKHILPLLDGFTMGNAISEHHGVRCHPAIKEQTDKKFIVKIISIPATQAQMDALLLAGAYKDPAEAMEYFREKGNALIKEAELLKKLSKLDGFLSYESWQMEPITKHRLGYELYLVGSYKRSLEKYMRHHAITHLEAINLGLDMCSALTVCRQAGSIYVDLKPTNIFLSERKEYRIGDLGFLPLEELRYSALPAKYQSSYTPPELYDPMASVNLTADTYALGMVLYQLYNDGHLPFKGKPSEEALPTPVNADYELAEIITKAIHPDPEQRWEDPAQMGKALAAYMQRNTINDVPITPLRIKKAKPAKSKETEESEQAPEKELVAVGAAQAAPEVAADTPPSPEASEELPAEQTLQEQSETEEVKEVVAEAAEEMEAAAASQEAEQVEAEAIPEAEPTSDPAQEPAEELSGELSEIFQKVDDLLSDETVEEPVFEEAPQEDPFAFATEDPDDIDDSDIPYDPLMEEEAEVPKKKRNSEQKFADPKYKRRRKRLVSFLVTLLILAVLGLGGFWYYQNIYLLPIDDIVIEGSQEQIIVTVDTTAEESLLRVSCLDNFGNAQTLPLTNGQAVFTGLQPNTMYIIQLQADGFHALMGKVSDNFTTEATTKIVSFTSVSGAEDGSVMLNFTVDGEEPEQWGIHYTAEGETERMDLFTGHTVTITGLTLGKRYTFTLDAGEGLSLGGQTTLELTATRLILAENLTVVSSGGDDMTVRWDAPGDVVVDSWEVRCYNANGYDETVTVNQTEVQFTGIDPSVEYTIEVTASGMTQPARTGITANPINIASLSADATNADALKVSWEFTGNKPEDGWLLMYTIDGGEANVVKTNTASASVTPNVPGGKYVFTIQAADGTSIFNNVHSYTAPDAPVYEGNSFDVSKLSVDLVKTPEGDWNFESIRTSDFTTEFASGDPISIVLRNSENFYLPGSRIKVLYVIRDSYGNVLSKYVSEQTLIWKDIWNGGDPKNGELDIPSVPTNPGTYKLQLYFDGMAVAEKDFTIN